MAFDYSKNIIGTSDSIKTALERLNSLESRESLTLFAVNDQKQLVGTLTDGDIRRGLLAGKTINDKVSEIMHNSFKFLKRNAFSLSDIESLRKREIDLVPLLNDQQQIIKIIDLNKKKSILPLDAVIMAGGEGRRLRPLTLEIPKPLVVIGNKPILEHNIDRLDAFGIDRIFITIKYLGEKIREYFGDGSSKQLAINYTAETDSLGTLGALSLIEDFEHDHILVMNSDLLTNIDFEDLYKLFIDEDADMVVASIPYNVDIPYGVIETQGAAIMAIKEKPRYTYYSNAGIYILKKSLLAYIPKATFFNATDLIELAIEKSLNIVHYPILDYWLDIGKHADYAKAQEDIKHLKF